VISIYTVIVGNYDNLRPIPVQSLTPGVRYVCFTDRPRQVRPWEVLPFPQVLVNGHRMSRIPKMLPHLLLPESAISVYMDGAFSLCTPPKQMVEDLLGDADVALFRHPCNKSFHDERNFYQKIHGFVPPDIEAEFQRYAGLNIPISGDFWAGGFLLRRHNEKVAKFNELWMREFVRGSNNDQFSLYYALSTMIAEGLKVNSLPGYYHAGGRLAYNFHATSQGSDNHQYIAENQAWAERVARIRELCSV
jgi:hypothetical protein